MIVEMGTGYGAMLLSFGLLSICTPTGYSHEISPSMTAHVRPRSIEATSSGNEVEGFHMIEGTGSFEVLNDDKIIDLIKDSSRHIGRVSFIPIDPEIDRMVTGLIAARLRDLAEDEELLIEEND